jgi:high-affinity nickel-transport protein
MSPPSLPLDPQALGALAFVMGLRHGLDADHLAAIDALTRFNSAARAPVARWCGVLFSLGHGGVVLIMGLLIAGATVHFALPEWLDLAGLAISCLLLVVLGLVNLASVLRAPAQAMVVPFGLRTGLISGLTRTGRPWRILAVGAVFAVSFDTLSQAALFGLAAVPMGGRLGIVALGLAFTLGMMTVDGLNGLWVAGMLRRADRRARIASRVMGLLVALLSFAVAALELARYALPGLDAWFSGEREMLPGLGVMLLAALVFAAVVWLVRQDRDPALQPEEGRCP